MGQAESIPEWQISLPLLLTCLLALLAAVLVASWGRAEARRGRKLSVCSAITGVLLVAAVAAGALLLRETAAYRASYRNRTTCLLNICLLRTALDMYVADYDRLPPADRWCDASQEYFRGAHDEVRPSGLGDHFRCPTRPDLRCGYAMNSAFSGADPEASSGGAFTALIFESDLGWNGHGGKEALVKTSRHFGQYAMACTGLRGYVTSKDLQPGGCVSWQPGFTAAPAARFVGPGAASPPPVPSTPGNTHGPKR